MTLTTDEFLRRFLLHLLPKGFMRIRNFGFLANRRRAAPFVPVFSASHPGTILQAELKHPVPVCGSARNAEVR